MEQASAPTGEAQASENTEPLFDVVVRIPPNTTLEQVDAQARAAGIAAERVEALMRALRNLPQVKIGSGVPRARADAARTQFSKAGLHVDITPVLGLQAKLEIASDGKSQCPACETRVLLSPHRQCPECGVYVDKVTEEDILRRRLLRQEKAKLDFQLARDAKNAEKQVRESLEASLREKIREELEEEYGLRRRRSVLTSPPVLGGVGAVLVAAAFFGGRGSLGEWPWQSGGGAKAAQVAAAPGSPDKMMESLGTPGASAGAQAAASGSAGTASGDPDVDDPLIRQAGGDRIGAKGLTVEQAVAAAQVLGKSVGNTTAERALAGGPSGASGAPDAAAAADPAALAAAASKTTDVAVVPPTLKTALALEFARELAEMGEWGRAQGMMKALLASSRTVADPVLAANAQAIDVEVRAWSLQAVPAGKTRSAADALLAQAQAVPTGMGQTRALGAAGAILSRHVALPAEVPRAFLQRASEAAKGIAAEPDRLRAVADLSLSIGQALLAEASVAARAGAWSRTQAAATQVEAIVAQVTDASVQARLLAIDAQIKAQLGKNDAAAQSLNRSLQLVQQTADLTERARLLQQVARLLPASAMPQVDAAAATLQSQALAKAGAERARPLVELAVLQANAGARSKANELVAAAAASPNLAETDAVVIHTNAIVRRELAQARLLHQAGQYNEAEAALRRVGDYLL